MQTQTSDRMESIKDTTSGEAHSLNARLVHKPEGAGKALEGDLVTPSIEDLQADARKFAASSLDTVVGSQERAPVAKNEASPDDTPDRIIGGAEVAQGIGFRLTALRDTMLQTMNGDA